MTKLSLLLLFIDMNIKYLIFFCSIIGVQSAVAQEDTEKQYDLEEVIFTGKSIIERIKEKAYNVNVVDAVKLHKWRCRF